MYALKPEGREIRGHEHTGKQPMEGTVQKVAQLNLPGQGSVA